MSGAAPIQEGARAPARSRVHEALSVLGVYVLVIVLFGAGCLISPEFLTTRNLLTALKTVTLLGMVCMGLAFVTYGRHYVDLSIPGIMALSGAVAITALKYGFAVSLVAGMATGVLIGLINGLVVGYLRLNPIIWTLAMVSVLSGVIRWAYGGLQVYPDASTEAGQAFLELYHVKLVNFRLAALGNVAVEVPLIVMVLVALAVLAHLVMSRTGYGAQLKLTGSAYEVARMTGVNVRRTVAIAFILSATTSAMAGILLTSFNKVAAFYIGRGYDFAAITAVVLGGMALVGGRGSIIGVIGGVLVIALLDNVLSLVKIGDFVVGEYQKRVIQGVVFILVVGVHSYSLRKTGVDDA
jgi:ribose/xylose/arabinose/galactoside ABC-type transport system permease subunit